MGLGFKSQHSLASYMTLNKLFNFFVLKVG